MSERTLIEYKANPEFDAVLLQWYTDLITTGAIKDLFNFRSRTLSGFYAALQPPIHLLVHVDDKGMWFAAIVTPIFAGAELDIWVREDKRTSKAWFEAMFEALAFCFDKYGTVIGLSTYQNVATLERLGYTILGKIPCLWDGDRDLWVMYVTRADFEARETHIVRRAAHG